MERIRVEIDAETARRLRELAIAERRGAADQAAVLIERALVRRRARSVSILAAGDGEPKE